MRLNPRVTTLLCSSAFLTLSACGTNEPPPAPPPAAKATPVETPAPVAAAAAAPGAATATLVALGGSGVTGTIKFTEKDGQVTLVADLTGLTPGNHGFHIHEFGDCSAADGISAGGHFNPAATTHGAYDPAQPHHAGDLGNILAAEGGHGTLTTTTAQFTLSPGPSCILGRGIIIHEKEDDLTTQPTGNAGGRVACAAILADDGSSAPLLAAPAASPAMAPAPSATP